MADIGSFAFSPVLQNYKNNNNKNLGSEHGAAHQ
jgi:hypothetical protein